MCEAAFGSTRRAGGESPVKRWLSPWVLPLVMLGVVVLVTRPLAGAIWLVTSVVLVRVFNGHFELPAEILKHLGITKVRLMTNNPEKVSSLETAGIEVVERVSAAIPTEPTFERYLETKREKMGHLVG